MKVTLTPYTQRHFTCKAATFLTPAQTSDLHELGHCESKSVKKIATSPFDINVASSSVVFMINAANWYETYVHTHTHALLLQFCQPEDGTRNKYKRVKLLHVDSSVFLPTSSVGRGVMKWGLVSVCLSVCLSLRVACLNLTLQRKWLGNSKLIRWKHFTQ